MPAAPDCCCCIRICGTTVCQGCRYLPIHYLTPIQILPNGESLTAFLYINNVEKHAKLSPFGRIWMGVSSLSFLLYCHFTGTFLSWMYDARLPARELFSLFR